MELLHFGPLPLADGSFGAPCRAATGLLVYLSDLSGVTCGACKDAMSPRIDRWMVAFVPALHAARAAHPDDYQWPASDVPIVAARMREAFLRGSFNKNSPAIKATCKTLGVAFTYAAIRAFLQGRP